MKKHQVKAHVIYDWNHHLCKFLPGDRVKVCKATRISDSDEKCLKKYAERYGIVYAATATEDGNMRGLSKYNYPRCHTRYYVEFPNGDVKGIHSQYLTKVGVAKHFEPYVPEQNTNDVSVNFKQNVRKNSAGEIIKPIPVVLPDAMCGLPEYSAEYKDSQSNEQLTVEQRLANAEKRIEVLENVNSELNKVLSTVK